MLGPHNVPPGDTPPQGGGGVKPSGHKHMVLYDSRGGEWLYLYQEAITAFLTWYCSWHLHNGWIAVCTILGTIKAIGKKGCVQMTAHMRFPGDK